MLLREERLLRRPKSALTVARFELGIQSRHRITSTNNHSTVNLCLLDLNFLMHTIVARVFLFNSTKILNLKIVRALVDVHSGGGSASFAVAMWHSAASRKINTDRSRSWLRLRRLPRVAQPPRLISD